MTKNIFLIFTGIIGILIILFVIYILIFISKEKTIYQIIPEDATAVISINNPIKLWTEFENSALWQNFQDTKIGNDAKLTFSVIRKRLGPERNKKLLQIHSQFPCQRNS